MRSYKTRRASRCPGESVMHTCPRVTFSVRGDAEMRDKHKVGQALEHRQATLEKAAEVLARTRPRPAVQRSPTTTWNIAETSRFGLCADEKPLQKD